MQEEREMIERIRVQMQVQEQQKKTATEQLRNDFIHQNAHKLSYNHESRQNELKQKKEEKLGYFPFVSGEMLEEHRKGMAV